MTTFLSDAVTPSVGGSGRAMYFSSQEGHFADTMSWIWETPPETDYTMEYWVKLVDNHRDSHSIFNYAVFDETMDPMYNAGYELMVEHTPESMGMYRYSNFYSQCFKCASASATPQSSWAHYAITYAASNDGETTYYINGVALTVTRAFEAGISGLDLPIVSGGMGMLGQTSDKFHDVYIHNWKADAVVDELRVWNYVRTQEQVLAGMVAPVADRAADGLTLYFNWDDTDGDDSVVQDMSGNGNHALVGKVATGKNALAFNVKPSPLAPTLPRYVVSGAGVSTGLPIVVGVRPYPAVNTITLLGSDADGDALTFAISALPSADVLQLSQFNASNGASGESSELITGAGAVVTDASRRVNLVLGADASLAVDGSQQLRYTVDDGTGGGVSEGVVELRPWTIRQPANLSMTVEEDVPTVLPLTDLDDFGNTLRVVITALPSRGTLYAPVWTFPFRYRDGFSGLQEDMLAVEVGALLPTLADFTTVVFVGDPNESSAPHEVYTTFSYAYTTDDQLTQSASAVVEVYVDSVNDAPLGVEQIVTVAEELAYSGGELEVVLSSSDVDQTFSPHWFYRVSRPPRSGSLLQVTVEGGGEAEVVSMEPSAQVLQWVDHVPSVSSQYSECGPVCFQIETCPLVGYEMPVSGGGDASQTTFDDDYYLPDGVCYGSGWHAEHMVGPPVYFPAVGGSPESWVGLRPCCGEWAVLQYVDAVYVSGVEVFELTEHGSVTEIRTAPYYTGDVDTTEWSTVFSRPEPVHGPVESFAPPLCPPVQASTVVMIVLDTSANPSAWTHVEAVKLLGGTRLGDGQLRSNIVMYRPPVGVHGSGSGEGVIDSFAFKSTDCVTESEAATPVHFVVPPPTDVKRALSWAEQHTSVAASGVESGVVRLDLLRTVADAEAEILAAEASAAGAGPADAADDDDVGSGVTMSVTVMYVSGATGSVYHYEPTAAVISGTISSNSSSDYKGEVLVVGDTLLPQWLASTGGGDDDSDGEEEGMALVFAPSATDGARVEVGLWADTGLRTYRLGVVVEYECDSGWVRSDADTGCERQIYICSGSEIVSDVSVCDATYQQRTAAFSFVDPQLCADTTLPPTVKFACDEVLRASSVGTIVTVLSILGAFCSLAGLCVVLVYRRRPVVRVAQLPFLLCFVGGSLLVSLTPLVMLGDNTDARCMSEAWAFHLSFSLMFAPMFVKIWRVWRILDNPKLKKVRIVNLVLYKQIAVILGVDLLILTAWTLLDPLQAVTSVEAEAGVGDVTHVRCESEGSAFVSVAGFYKACLLAAGSYLSWKTRNFDSNFSEAKYLMFAMYNVSLIAALVLLLTSGSATAETRVMLQGLGMVWCATLSLLLVLAPKFIARNKMGSNNTSYTGRAPPGATDVYGGNVPSQSTISSRRTTGAMLTVQGRVFDSNDLHAAEAGMRELEALVEKLRTAKARELEHHQELTTSS